MEVIPFSKPKTKKRRKTKSMDDIAELKFNLVRSATVLAAKILNLSLNTIEERQRVGFTSSEDIPPYVVVFKDEQDLANKLNIPIEDISSNDLEFALTLGKTGIILPDSDFDSTTFLSLFMFSYYEEDDDRTEIRIQPNTSLLEYSRDTIFCAMYTAIFARNNISF